MTTTAEVRPPEESGQGVQPLDVIWRGIEGKLKNMVEMVYFSGQILTAIPRTWKYSSEVFRQTGIMILSSGFVVVFIQLIQGFVFGVQGHYIIRQFGAQGYVAVFPALGGLRFCIPEMAGWILAAKVGCGLVAEIGSARISDEIDALEVMGIESKVYLVATRVLAAIIAMPFLFSIGLILYYFGAYVACVHLLRTVSEGGFWNILWTYQTPLDMALSTLWGLMCGLTVILVGCYYGYHARGGPVGVGQNTAKSMVVNMVMVSVVGLICQQAFWGGFPNAPIGN
ncbi:phospholipid/cholesterol/gamma-HCH transport system permease protein [Pseudonocardia eucalypti]|uniref:ABC transporter permease n=1 Tax=Pseudonocardia eucalypti TaxID=648755 RepID=UPI001829945B|nr:phospholipid/cholesterol/gamma-HCH transport system permease protein [Pseudonocardia eucalypti]